MKALKLKAYKPEKLVAVSRFREFFPNLPFGVQRDVYGCMCQTKERRK